MKQKISKRTGAKPEHVHVTREPLRTQLVAAIRRHHMKHGTITQRDIGNILRERFAFTPHQLHGAGMIVKHLVAHEVLLPTERFSNSSKNSYTVVANGKHDRPQREPSQGEGTRSPLGEHVDKILRLRDELAFRLGDTVSKVADIDRQLAEIRSVIGKLEDEAARLAADRAKLTEGSGWQAFEDYDRKLTEIKATLGLP